MTPADRLSIKYRAERANHKPTKHLLRTLILARAKELKTEARKSKRKQLSFNI